MSEKPLLEFKFGDDPLSFIEVINDHWWNPEWGIKERGVKVVHLELHTGGYSDNEQLINELQNTDFWRLYWVKTERGGHYYFKIDTRKVKK